VDREAYVLFGLVSAIGFIAAGMGFGGGLVGALVAGRFDRHSEES